MKPKAGLVTALVAAALMIGTNGLAYVARPTVRVADMSPRIDLERLVPKQFGEWREEIATVAQVVNPQQEEMLQRLYSEILTRTYVNASGQRIMLSIAYGGDQSDSNQVHEPERCYPAQGFQLTSSKEDFIRTGFGPIPVKRITTTLGPRVEPVTYWVSIGQHVVHPGIRKKIEEMKYSVRGQIPDGLLFRVSSIDRNETAAFEMQDSFVRQMLDSISPNARQRLAGLAPQLGPAVN